MNRERQNLLEQYTKKIRGRRLWKRFVRVVAGVVVFCTTYALILPAITMEQKAFCGLEEHVHDDACYTPVTTPTDAVGETAGHVHTDTCLDASGAVICGYHVHSDACYTRERGDLLCQQAEQEKHAHTEQCHSTEAVLTCQTAETAGHTHGEACYAPQQVLSCQLDEAEPHTHGDGCFDEEGTLICQTEETAGHSHGVECYTEQQALTCQLPEAEPHTHGPDCWEYPLICGQTAAEGHTHNDDCYQWDTTLTCDLPLAPGETTPPQPELTCDDAPHAHTQRCYGTWELTCGKEEHTHDLACFSDPNADVETREVWERTFETVKLTGLWGDDVVAIAESQLGYHESTRNYTVGEDGTTHGYTRYGDWYGSPYGDWCAMFASFCIHYAGVEGMPLNWGCRTWIADLSQPELDLYRPAADYTPKPGDLIFFDWEDADGNSDDLSDHVGIVAELLPATQEQPARIKTIEGNSSNQVKYNTYDQADTRILGYGVIPENPANGEPAAPGDAGRTYTYSGETLYVEVRLPEDTTVPAGAVLWVTPIDAESADYAAYLARSEEAVEGLVAGIALYDISFYTPDGDYIPVSDTAEVTMGFTHSPVEGEGEIRVLHFAGEDTPPQVIDQVTIGEQELEMRLEGEPKDEPAPMALMEEAPTEPTEPTRQTETEPQTITERRTVVQFQTDGFSTFAVVQVETGVYRGTIHAPVKGSATIDGHPSVTGIVGDKQYILVSANEKHALSGYATIQGGNDKLKGMDVLHFSDNEVYVNANKHLLWTFEGTGQTGKVYIRNVATGEYLQLVRNNVAITTQLLPENDFQNRQMIYALKDNAEGSNIVAFCAVNMGYDENGNPVEDGNGNPYYLNWDGDKPWFHTWQGNFTDKNNQFYLYEYQEKVDNLPNKPDSGNLATDLGGKVAYIMAVNNNNNEEPPAMASKTGQTAVRVNANITNNTVTQDSAQEDPDGILGWVFEDTDTPGKYYIRAVSGENKGKYLNIVATQDDFEMTATPQAIEVIRANTSAGNLDVKENVISLRAEVDGKYRYVHLGNNNPNQVTSGFQCKAEGEQNFTVAATHFQLVEITEVSNVVSKINTLLDNMILQEDGSWTFSNAAFTGSAAEENDNNGHQGEHSANGQQPFVDDYNQAQAYRREMQLLAREIRSLYAELPEEDRRYVWRYEIVDSNGGKEHDLQWLWDVVGVVQPNNPTGVKVNLFNYDQSVNDTGLAYGREGNYNNPKGFTFYHKIQYDEYTQVDTGRDEQRPKGGGLGSDDSQLNMSPTLGTDGYPVVTGGAGDEYSTQNNNSTGSLAYLFTPNNQYWRATMDDGGGLFRRDAQGYYYYNANENAAWYNPDNNQFVLYDTVIRPMYIHGAAPKNTNDAYNFLPFNNPHDDLIFDEPNTIKPNTDLATNHTANTARSGYLNERADMWFGMTIEFSFLMANNGKVDILDKNGQPTGEQVDMVFDFYGDDDVWVYIDNQLVLDLGGVKGAEQGSINFATGAVSYVDRKDPINKTLAQIFNGVEGAQLNGDTFADGVAHTLKFFYLERGGNVSYCGLRFNMPLIPENFLMVTKSRDNEEENGTAPIGNPYHTFRVVEANQAGKPVDTSGQETTELDKMVPYFKENIVFDICHANTTAPVVDTGIVDQDGYFTIPVGYSAVFNDVLNLRREDTKVNYAIVEVLYDVEKDQYTYLNYTLNTVQGRAEPSTPDFSVGGVELYTRPVGSFTYTTGIDATLSNTLNLTNKVKEPMGQLSVTKELAPGVDEEHKNDAFTVKVEFGGYAIVEKDGTVTSELVYTPAPMGTAYTLTYMDGGESKSEAKTITSNDGTIQLKPGQTATFNGIVAGTWYRITEVLDTDSKWIPTYSGMVTGLDANAPGTPTESTEGNATGEIGLNQSASVTITNRDFTVSVDLSLRKKVEYAAMTDTFTFNVQWIQNATSLEQAKEAADGYYNLPGTSITVTPKEAQAGGPGKVIIGFSNASITAMLHDTGMAYYKISEQPGNGGYLYDGTYYIVGVKITKNPASAQITEIWKNGTDPVYPAEPVAAVPELEFTNHRTTSVTVEKEVTTGSTVDTFKYTYKVIYPNGTEYTTGSFDLKHNGKHIITGIPIGATVEVKEEERDDYAASYNVTAVYEAEYGTISGAAVVYEGNPSGGAYVGNIKGATQTVTIPVYTNAQIGADFIFRYAQDAKRSFTVRGEVYPMPSTQGWQTWQEDTQAHLGPTLKVGANTLTIGGNENADAPNLDYLKVIFGTVTGNTAAVNVLGDGSVIHFTNRPVYELPMTGGAGTQLYTVGGLLLMAAALLLYSQSRRRKGGHASP